LLTQLLTPQRPGPTPFREVASIAPEWLLIRKGMPEKGTKKRSAVAQNQRKSSNCWREATAPNASTLASWPAFIAFGDALAH
jgi:hypothetical protein